MKRRLVAVALAFAILVPVSIQPAQAQPGSTQSVTTVQEWLTIVNTAWNLIKSVLGSGGPSISDAINQIVAKIEQSKTEILSHIDAIATAEAKACARHAVVEFADVNLFNPDVLQGWTQNVTGCAISIDSLIGSVTDTGQKDQLGFALNIAGPIAIAARIKVGFTTSLLIETLKHGQNGIISQLFPGCTTTWVNDPPIREEQYYCVAYNGEWGYATRVWRNGKPLGNPINRYATENQATRNTSRAVAQAALQVMPA
jgi:hypothetical protein